MKKIITSEGTFSVTGRGWEPIGRFLDKDPIDPKKILSLNKLLLVSAHCQKANLLKKDNEYEIIGDPTEAALLVLAKKAGIDRKKSSENVIDDLVFSSELKFRASLVKNKDKKQLYVLGAFEELLKRSTKYLKADRKMIMDPKMRRQFLNDASGLAKKGMRVLALAYKDVPPHTDKAASDSVNNLVLVGLVGMKDPPKEEVKEAIVKARNAGIRVIMKTGDHKETAVAIAREVGLVYGEAEVISEEQLEKMSDSEFHKAVKEVNIFARVTPKMKMKIVEELQKQGEVVAMSGDGVNDAPALKRADIGISMGIMGTDVARESSEIVLTDDNFASIVNAVEEGRIVFQNVRQTSFYLISTNVAEDITIVSSLIAGLPLPMLPIQILYMNLVTDTIQGVSLSMEPGHRDLLNEPPKNKKEKILNKEIFIFLALLAVVMPTGLILLFKHFLPQGLDKARTVAFVTMSFFQLFNVYNMRSLKKSVFEIGIFSNKWVTFGMLSAFVLMVSVIYIPFLANIFQFAPLSLKEFLFLIPIGSTVLILGEIYKLFKYERLL